MARSENRAPRVFVWWLLTLYWSANMFWLSTEPFGGAHTASILSGIFGLLNFSVSPNMLDLINTILRKLSHVAEYAVLGFLVYRSLGSRDNSQLAPGKPPAKRLDVQLLSLVV